MESRHLYKAKKSKHSDLWYVGGYYKFLPYTRNPLGDSIDETDYKHFIITHDFGMPRNLSYVEIDVKTLCQCTGNKDSNGKPIWEYDIMRRHNPDGSYTHGEVHWNPQLCKFLLVKDDGDCVNFPLISWEVVRSKYDRNSQKPF